MSLVRVVARGLAAMAAVACLSACNAESPERRAGGVAATSAAADSPADDAAVEVITPPAARGSTSPTLLSERDRILGRDFLLMTWLEPDPGGSSQRLRFARFLDDGWGAAFTVARGVDSAADGASSLAAVDTDTGRATLLVRSGDLVARSSDGGRIWKRLSTASLTFGSLVGGFEEGYAFWLAPGAEGALALWGGEAFADPTVLDPFVAVPSATSAAMTTDGPIVVYRDRVLDDDTVSVAIVRRDGARWTAPDVVHGDGWKPKGQTIPAPAVAAQERNVVLAWTTGAQANPRLLATFSSDAGATFSDVQGAVGSWRAYAPEGPLAVAIDESGEAFLAWLAAEPDGDHVVLVSRVAEGARPATPFVVAMTGAVAPTALGLALWDERVALSWEERGAGIHAVAVRKSAIAAPAEALSPLAAESVARIGDMAPNLDAVTLAGDSVSLVSLRGRAVLLNFWATWCLPCREELPELASLHDLHAEQDLAVIGINVDVASAAESVREFVADAGVPFEVWLDPDERLSRTMGVRSLPATFVLDRRGRVLLRRDRPVTAGDVELAEALARAMKDR